MVFLVYAPSLDVFFFQRSVASHISFLYSCLLDFVTDLPFIPSVVFHIPPFSSIYVLYNLPDFSVLACIYLSSIGFFPSIVSLAYSFLLPPPFLDEARDGRIRHLSISWPLNLQCNSILVSNLLSGFSLRKL